MKAIVTGGAGFIGSHVVDTLIQKGYEVIVIDDLSTGSEANLNPKAKFIRVERTSLNSRGLWSYLPNQVDLLVHFAAKTSVVESMREPHLYFDTNCTPSKLIGEWCMETEVKQVIYANTAGTMYGNAGDCGHKEDSPPNPISPYAATKYMAELYLSTLPINLVSLRFANVYGERQSSKGEAGVIPIWAEKMNRGDPCFIFGTGKTRDYIHVSDVCSAVSRILEIGPMKDVFNIGSGVEVEDIEVYRQVAKSAECDRDPVFSDFREGELTRTYLDISKAKRVLSWEPKVDFAEGVEKTVKSLSALYTSTDTWTS